jgi:hypothetical protein
MKHKIVLLILIGCQMLHKATTVCSFNLIGLGGAHRADSMASNTCGSLRNQVND